MALQINLASPQQAANWLQWLGIEFEDWLHAQISMDNRAQTYRPNAYGWAFYGISALLIVTIIKKVRKRG